MVRGRKKRHPDSGGVPALNSTPNPPEPHVQHADLSHIRSRPGGPLKAGLMDLLLLERKNQEFGIAATMMISTLAPGTATLT